jgi:hypothetical protein
MFVIITALVLSVVAWILFTTQQHETIEPLLVYNVDVDDSPILLKSDGYDLSQKAIDMFKNIPFSKMADKNQNPHIYTTDIFTYSNKKAGKLLGVIPDEEKALLLIKKRDVYPYETLNELAKHKKVVGYPTDTHKDIFLLLCRAYNIDPPQMKAETSLEKVDVLIFFESLNNKKTLPMGEEIDFVDYDKFDLHKLKAELPYCKIKAKPMDVYFKGSYRDKYPVRKFITIDMVLVANHHFTKWEYLPNLDVPATNFVKMAIEPFENAVINITPKNNVKGHLQDDTFQVSFPLTILDDIPLTPGVRIALENQDNPHENGEYIVTQSLHVWKKVKKTRYYMEKHECIGKPTASTEEQCGEKNIWDKRCEYHDECPFFQSNKTYKNYFGGCQDGYCQMPIGVKRVGYTKYQCEKECPKPQHMRFALDLFEKRRQ